MGKYQIPSGRKLGRALCVLFSTFAVILALTLEYRTQPTKILLQLSSADKAIEIAWKTTGEKTASQKELSIWNGSTLVFSQELPSQSGRYVFSEGEHGTRYRVVISNSDGELASSESLFLDYDRLPELPLLIINTKSGNDPTYREAKKPTGDCRSDSITDNAYEEAELQYVNDDSMPANNMNARVKVRGNTSALYHSQKPYKLQLDTPADLLQTENSVPLTEWVLLSCMDNLNTFVGSYIASVCQMEWQIDIKFVNVMMNGDWKGCYILAPQVNEKSAGELVDECGYLFENDMYWWRKDEIYFRLTNQPNYMAFTMKYPKVISVKDERVQALRQHLQMVEDMIIAGDEAVFDYLDMDSMVKWLLVQDIIGNRDAGGSNMFYYKKGGIDTDSKIKIGPLWDFEWIFEDTYQWSKIHYSEINYYDRLLWIAPFYQKYRAEWEKISPDLYENICRELDALENDCGDALSASWALDTARYKSESASIPQRKAEVLNWFQERIAWMNSVLDDIYDTVDVTDYTIVEDSLSYYVDFERSDEGISGIRGWAFTDETITSGRIGVKIGDEVYLARTEERPDVQQYYDLDREDVGFIIECPCSAGREICIVDQINQKVYLKK